MKNLAALAGSIFLLVSACSNGDIAGPDASVPLYQFTVGIIDATASVAHDLVVCDSKENACALITDTTYRTKRLNFNPAWSPDGRFLAFINSTDGVTSLVIADIESKTRRVVEGFAPDERYFPSWSPNGSRIAVKSQASPTISVLSTDGLIVSDLALQSWESYPGQPYWSGDGASIAVADGSNAVQIFSVGGDSVAHLSGTGILNGWAQNSTEIITTKMLATDTLALNRIGIINGNKTRVAIVPITGPYSMGLTSRQYTELPIINNDKLLRVNIADGTILEVLAPYPIKKASLSSDGRAVAYVTTPDPLNAFTSEVRLMNIDGSDDKFIRKGLTVFLSPIVRQ